MNKENLYYKNGKQKKKYMLCESKGKITELKRLYDKKVIQCAGAMCPYYSLDWQLREDLCQKDKQIADLQHRLEVAERTTKLACDELRDLNYRTFDNADIDFEEQFKEQAEKEIKGK